jgi:hypothetical protein
MIAPNGNQKGIRMWPSLSLSLETANKIGDIANILLIGSLAVGVASTIAIVWMSSIKEANWDSDRRVSAEKIAALTTQGDELRKQTADAQARTAEARLALERLKTPRTLRPERQHFVTAATAAFAGQRYRTTAISQAADDGPAFWESLYGALEAAGWVYLPISPGQPAIGDPPAGIPIAAAPGVEIVFDPSREREETAPALALGNALHADGMAVAVNRDRQSNPSEADRDILLIRIGARVPPQ